MSYSIMVKDISIPLTNVKNVLDLFDNECILRYGQKTCILIHYIKDIFELRLLDESLDDRKMVSQRAFYDLIPKLLTDQYTVVIVETINGGRAITAVHLPKQAQLATPPIIQ